MMQSYQRKSLRFTVDMIDPRVAYSTQPTFGLFYRQAKKTASLTLQFGSSGPKRVISIYVFFCIFAPFFLSIVDTEPCSSASRLPGIDFAKITPEIICETDFPPKKTKHVRISFQYRPGGLKYRI